MNRNNEKNLIVGLDIGTSKVVAIVGEINNSDEIEVVGIGSHPSKGLKRGVVVNIESTVQSIQIQLHQALALLSADLASQLPPRYLRPPIPTRLDH